MMLFMRVLFLFLLARSAGGNPSPVTSSPSLSPQIVNPTAAPSPRDTVITRTSSFTFSMMFLDRELGCLDGDQFSHFLYATTTSSQVARINLTAAFPMFESSGRQPIQIENVTFQLGGAGYGNVDGQLDIAKFNAPSDLACFEPDIGNPVSSVSFLYIADTGNKKIRMLDLSTEEVTTVAGSVGGGGSFRDGYGTTVVFSDPRSVAISRSYTLYVADTHRICAINTNPSVSPRYNVTTITGSATPASIDGPFSSAKFGLPISIDVLDFPHGTQPFPAVARTFVYVIDASEYSVRKLDFTSQTVSTVAGNSHISGYLDGPAVSAQFRGLQCISLVPNTDPAIIYITESENRVIRAINEAVGEVTTAAGLQTNTTIPLEDGTSADATFGTPVGIYYSGGGSSDQDYAFVTDAHWRSIRIVAKGAPPTLQPSINPSPAPTSISPTTSPESDAPSNVPSQSPSTTVPVTTSPSTLSPTIDFQRCLQIQGPNEGWIFATFSYHLTMVCTLTPQAIFWKLSNRTSGSTVNVRVVHSSPIPSLLRLTSSNITNIVGIGGGVLGISGCANFTSNSPSSSVLVPIIVCQKIEDKVEK
eukprot:jgi/Bigna1/77422/fgenesh1_pg.48_\